MMKRITAFILAAAVSGCGVYTPDKDPFRSDAVLENGQTSQGIYETAITNHIACQIGEGLQQSEILKLPWLTNEWGTTVTQTITVEDQTGLSPGISTIAPYPNGFFPFPAASGGNVTIAQSFSNNIGGTASANALRTETIQYTFRNKDLLELKRHTTCEKKTLGVMIEGDLKIKEFIYDKGLIARSSNLQTTPPENRPSENGPLLWQIPPFNTFTEEVTFVGSYGASVTPTWHLARLTANTSSNLLVSQRTNTNDLVITLGPVKCPQPAFGDVVPLSQLLHLVEQRRVKRVVLKGAEIDAFLTNDTKVLAYAPSFPDLAQHFYSHGVSVEAKGQECPLNSPVVLVDAAMSQHQARVQANALAVSITAQTH